MKTIKELKIFKKMTHNAKIIYYVAGLTKTNAVYFYNLQQFEYAFSSNCIGRYRGDFSKIYEAFRRFKLPSLYFDEWGLNASIEGEHFRDIFRRRGNNGMI